MRNIEENIDMKENVWLTNVKYLWLSLNTLWALAFCIDTHVYTISKVIGIYEEKEICQTWNTQVIIDEEDNMVITCIVLLS